jgi:hypothetical protein
LLNRLLQLLQGRLGRDGQRILDATEQQSRGDQVLTGAVVEIAGDAAALLVLRANHGYGELAQRVLGTSQLVDQGAQQKHGYRKAGQKQLQGEDAPFGVFVKQQARPMQRP